MNHLSLSFTNIAILSSLFAAVAGILARTLLKDIRSQDILGINFLTMAVTLSLLSPWFFYLKASFLVLGLVVIIAVIDTVANYFFFKTFEKTEASVAVPILSLSPAFTLIASSLTLHDHLAFKSLLICVVIIAATIYFSVDFSNFKKFNAETLKPGLLSALLFGLSAIPAKYLLSNLHAINSLTLYMFRAGFIAIFSLLFFNFSIGNITIKQYRIIFLRSLFVISQYGLLYWALSLGNAGVTVTLANITPVFVFLFSLIFLKERPTLKKISAAFVILAFSLII